MNTSKKERAIIGTQDKKNKKFVVWAVIDSDKKLLEFSQYLIDSCPDTSDFLIIREKNGVAYDFTGIVRDILKLKSKRFNTEAN